MLLYFFDNYTTDFGEYTRFFLFDLTLLLSFYCSATYHRPAKKILKTNGKQKPNEQGKTNKGTSAMARHL